MRVKVATIEKSRMAKTVANSGAIIAVFLFLLTWTGSLAAISADDASKYIYGFRKDNQFSLLLSFASHKWQLRAEDEFTDRSVAAHFVYRFQLQLAKNFGYYLGTRFGFRQSFPVQRRNFYTLLMPGAAFGVIWYVNARWQALLGMEIFLERVPHLPAQENLLPDLSLASYAGVLTVERYFLLNTAVVVAVAFDTLQHRVQRKHGERVTDLQRQGWRVSLGVNYHLL